MNGPMILLKQGTESLQGKTQLISNINACQSIAEAVRTTLGPRGMDKLIVGEKGVIISNDGATILKHLNVAHPAARALVDISRSQDAEVGDGTTSVTLLAAEFLKHAKPFVEDGLHPQIIIKSYREGCRLCIERIDEISVLIGNSNKQNIDKSDQSLMRSVLEKCANTTLSSKLIAHQKELFTKIAVDAVMQLDELLPLNMIGIKKVTGGSIDESMLVAGVAFKKTFSYAGFEMQPKKYQNAKIALLNIELELKAERENAEVRVDNVEEYQKIVDAEWQILYDKLDKIHASGANVVLSMLPIGDVATQYFADRDMFCAGRVAQDDLKRTMKACGGSILTTVYDLNDSNLGRCELFEEKQIGSERYNFFTGCPHAKTVTIILRGGADQFIDETERSLHDAIMIVRRALKNDRVVAGGGAIEMELSKYLREHSRKIQGKEQLLIGAMAEAFEIIPQQLCDNAGFDSPIILNKLRFKHHSEGGMWYGVDIHTEDIADNYDSCVWEPAVVKKNAIIAATEAACLILSVDETIRAPKSEREESAAQRQMGNHLTEIERQCPEDHPEATRAGENTAEMSPPPSPQSNPPASPQSPPPTVGVHASPSQGSGGSPVDRQHQTPPGSPVDNTAQSRGIAPVHTKLPEPSASKSRKISGRHQDATPLPQVGYHPPPASPHPVSICYASSRSVNQSQVDVTHNRPPGLPLVQRGDGYVEPRVANLAYHSQPGDYHPPGAQGMSTLDSVASNIGSHSTIGQHRVTSPIKNHPPASRPVSPLDAKQLKGHHNGELLKGRRNRNESLSQHLQQVMIGSVDVPSVSEIDSTIVSTSITETPIEEADSSGYTGSRKGSNKGNEFREKSTESISLTNEPSEESHDSDEEARAAAEAIGAVYFPNLLKLRGYTLGSEIGSGAFSRVHIAYNPKISEREIAVKMITLENVPAAWKDKCLRKELKIMRRLEHPHIIKVFDVIKTRRSVFVFMEYAANNSIHHQLQLKKAPINEDTSKLWFTQIAGAISYIHSKNVAHRDLKNENILLDKDMNAKLTDFGFACFTIDKISRKPIFAPTCCGTVSYIAPEVLNPPYDARKADIWSFGVCLYEMVCYVKPFSEKLDQKQLLKLQLTKHWKFPSELNLNKQLRQLISLMLEPDVQRRIAIDDVLEHAWVNTY